MAFCTSDFRERTDISHTDRPTPLSPDLAAHRALQLRVRGTGGSVPAPWGLEHQRSSLEKGFSVEAELAVLRLALWLARRPSGIICAPSRQTGATLRAGRGQGGGRDLLLTGGQKEAIFLAQLRRLPSSTGTAIAPARSFVRYLTYHVCILPQQFRPVCYQEQVPNWSMEFSRQASGTACC